MPSGEAEYIAAATAFMRASHLCMLIYDIWFLGTSEYDEDNLNSQPTRIIIDNDAAISITKCSGNSMWQEDLIM